MAKAEGKTRRPKARANGEGTLFQRADGLWVGRVPKGVKLNGKPDYIQFTGKFQGDVLEKMDKVKSEVRTGAYVEPNKLTVKDWLDTWLNVTIKDSIRTTSWFAYKNLIEKHVVPAIGSIKLMQLQTSDIQALYNDRLKNGRQEKVNVDGKITIKTSGLSPATIRLMHVTIHQALKQAVLEKHIMVNVADNTKLPTNPRKEMKTLTNKDIEKFLNSAKTTRYYAAFVLDLDTGLRRGELLGLRWKDIDFKEKEIKVVQQLVYEYGKHVIRELKTKSSQNRVIAISDDTIEALKEHRKNQRNERKGLGQSEAYDGLVFTNELGGCVAIRSFEKIFKRILKNANVQPVRFHDLRHTFAMISLQSGVDIKVLQNDMGHSSVSITLDKYGHVNKEMKHDAAEKRNQWRQSKMTQNQ